MINVKNKIILAVLMLSLMISDTVFALPQGLWEESGRIEDTFGEIREEVKTEENGIGTEKSLIENLGILKAEDMNKDVTYEDFLKSISVISGYGDNTGIESIFEAYKSSGIITSSVMPQKVKQQEMVYAGVKLINIAEITQTEGSILSLAQQSKLLNGFTYNPKGYITYKDYYKFLYNLLTADAKNIVTMNNGRINIEYNSDVTVLEQRFDVTEIRGIFNAYEITDIYEKSELMDGFGEIDKTLYECADINAEKYIGYSVKAYVIEEEEKIVALENYRNDEYTFNSRSLNAVSDTLLTVEADKLKRLKVNSSTRVVYNKVYDTVYTEAVGEMLYNRPMEVKAIDNDGNGLFDVLFITDYMTYAAKSDVALTGNIYLDYGMEFKGNGYIETDVDDTIVILKDGIEILPNDIKLGNILSVAASKNQTGKTYTEILVSDKTVTGTVTSMRDTDDGYTVVIEEKSYILNHDYLKNTGLDGANPNTEIEAVKNGLFAQYKLDAFGCIADCKKTSDSEQLGFLVKLKKLDSTEVETEMTEEYLIRARIMTPEGEFIDLDFKSNINLYYTEKERGEKLSSVDAYDKIRTKLGSDVRSLILYKANASGEIRELWLPIDNTAGNIENYPLTLDKVPSSETAKMRYYMGMLDTMYITSSSTPMYQVPSADEADKEKLYKSTTIGANGNDFYYTNLKLYSCDEFSQPRVVLYQSSAIGGGSVSNTADFAVIDKMIETLDEDDQAVKTICYWSGNEYKQSQISDMEMTGTSQDSEYWEKNVKITDLKFGDVVQFSVSDTNKIGAFRVINRMDFSDGYESSFGYTNEYGRKVTEAGYLIDQPIIMSIYGRVMDNKDDLVKVTFVNNKSGSLMTDTTFKLDAACKVYLVDRKTGKIRLSSKNEVEQGDIVVARRNYHIARDMIIYR